jgi:hypothetical protein
VAFPDAKPIGIRVFVHEIQQTEGIVASAVRNLAGSMNELLEVRSVRPKRQELQDRLSVCAGAGDVRQMNLLLTAYLGELDINGKDAQGVAPLHAAVSAGQVLVVEYIVKIKVADKNIRDAEGNTPLIAAVKGGQARIVAYLAQTKGVDVNSQNNYGWTALHMAALLTPAWTDLMIAMLARARNIRVDLEDWEGKRPFADNPQLMATFQAKQKDAAAKGPKKQRK